MTEMVELPRYRVLAVGVNPEHRVVLLNQLLAVLAVGGEALLVVAGRADWEPLSPRITVIDVASDSQRCGLNRLARLTPTRLLVAAAGATMSLRARGPIRTVVGVVLTVTALGVRPGRRTSPWWPRWTRSQLAQDSAGWAMWRALRPHLDQVAPQSLDEILFRDVLAWAVVWQLARLNPRARVGTSVDGPAVDEFTVRRSAVLAASPAGRRQLARERRRAALLRVTRSRPGRLVRWALPASAVRRAKDRLVG
jgi:hypothetical protein